MTLIGNTLDLEILPFVTPGMLQIFWHSLAQRRLNGVLSAAPRLTYDEHSRLVLFSDLHRGDNGHADAFAPNRNLFLHALGHYWQQGYSYVEVGDGDELWKNRHFADIRRAHAPVFDLLHRFHSEGRLYLLTGNHDAERAATRDGLPLSEGLVLRRRYSGQELLVVHGHQADFKNDRLGVTLRFFAQHVLRHLQSHGLRTTLPEAHLLRETGRLMQQVARWAQINQRAIEQKLLGWSQARGQALICGHTHRPCFARPGEPPYFNTGSCIQPGYITGLEIIHGQISLVRWRAQEVPRGGVAYVREALSAPRSLAGVV